MSKAIYLAAEAYKKNTGSVTGDFFSLDGDRFYRIHNYSEMPPFFMSLVSPSDHWLFIASNGGLSAGRVNAESALFPYYTDDKIIDAAEYTGSKTIVRRKTPQGYQLWEPFSAFGAGLYQLEHNLYKNTVGNRLRFEEINKDLNLRFAYEWSFSDKYGIIRKAWLENIGSARQEIEILDGVQNLLPAALGSALQTNRSTLVDAYKKNELLEEEQLAIYSLSARIIDRAEPSEALIANTIWSTGLKPKAILVSNSKLRDYRRGEDLSTETLSKGQKGAYFINAELKLESGSEESWIMVAELNQSTADVLNLKSFIAEHKSEDLMRIVDEARAQDQDQLRAIVAKGDGLQCSELETVTTRHYGNVLFNVMRGGLFESAYSIDRNDFIQYLNQASLKTALNFDREVRNWPEKMDYEVFLQEVRKLMDGNLERVALEYLPLSFSRRHGDPSRPWNVFNIHTKDARGNRLVSYEGNWRDIFQNWEALAYSYPAYIQGMITKFLNASTIDAYNPYRISKEGIDWEVIEEDDPWSYIGYWGDHQIIYLQKLLEHWDRHQPKALLSEWNRPNYTYANVPYRIRGFEAILKDPKDTIDFDHRLDAESKDQISKLGSDAKMIWKDGSLLKANLAEKLLLTAATKLYNLVPDGGIWMNTQRPEWNDANNALVGNGLSMVTLYYLRRYLTFLKGQIANVPVELNEALQALISAIYATMKGHEGPLSAGFTPTERFQFVESLGKAGEAYRDKAYNKDLGSRSQMEGQQIVDFLDLSLAYLDGSIATNQREDGLYHAYNLLQIKGKEMRIRFLYEMLEGQVAILSAGYLNPTQSLNLLTKLKESALYREDQYSYMLYPNRDIASFVDKNNIDSNFAAQSKLIEALMARNDRRLIERDSAGNYHFAANISNAKDVELELNKHSNGRLTKEVAAEREALLEEFERIFDHQSFTGRSGTFYAYEGLGSIYWHMVSKLLLAVQENLQVAEEQNSDTQVKGALIDHYYSIRAGIGLNKGPELYGAFPFDPYSHTPWDAGVQQPGMTGQVKEDILNRWAELGVAVEEGQLSFRPFFFDPKELLSKSTTFSYYDHQAQALSCQLNANEMAFTYCGLLIRFRNSAHSSVSLMSEAGQVGTWSNLRLPRQESKQILNRNHNYTELVLEHPFK